MSTFIGIDLGTSVTYSAKRTGERVNIVDSMGLRSVVSFKSKKPIVGVGNPGTVRDPKSLVQQAKRVIGLMYKDQQVEDCVERLPFELVKDKRGRCRIKVNWNEEERMISPELCAALILAKERKTILVSTDESEIGGLVISVPTSFGESRRQATRDAAIIAGWKCKIHLVSEPVCAALSKVSEQKEKRLTVVAIDFGGGTFGATLFQIVLQHDGSKLYKMLSKTGESFLGGADITFKLAELIKRKIEQEMGEDGGEIDTKALAKINQIAEQAKKHWTDTDDDYVVDINVNRQQFEFPVTYNEFKDLCERFVTTMRDTIEDLFGSNTQTSHVKIEHVDSVVMVGGSCYIRPVQETIKTMFNGKDIKTADNLNLAVAFGAANYCPSLCNPESQSDLAVLDICHTSYSIETEGGKMQTIIQRNDTLPAEGLKTFYSRGRYKSEIRIAVYEGELPIVSKNTCLGKFRLPIPRTDKQLPLDVMFSIQPDGILKVEAKLQENDEKLSIEVKGNNSACLTEDEISELQKLIESDFEDLENVAQFKIDASSGEHNSDEEFDSDLFSSDEEFGGDLFSSDEEFGSNASNGETGSPSPKRPKFDENCH